MKNDEIEREFSRVVAQIRKHIERTYPGNPVEIRRDPEDSRSVYFRIHCVAPEAERLVRSTLWEIIDSYEDDLPENRFVGFVCINDTIGHLK